MTSEYEAEATEQTEVVVAEKQWTLDDLIGACDPDRDYGAYRDLKGIKKAVIAGELTIRPPYEGTNQPVIFERTTGRRVRGSGVPLPKGAGDTRVWARARFNERAAEDFDDVYKDLIEQCHMGNDRAIKLFLEMFLGQPKQQSDAPMSEIFSMLLEKLQTPRETVIEVR